MTLLGRGYSLSVKRLWLVTYHILITLHDVMFAPPCSLITGTAVLNMTGLTKGNTPSGDRGPESLYIVHHSNCKSISWKCKQWLPVIPCRPSETTRMQRGKDEGSVQWPTSLPPYFWFPFILPLLKHQSSSVTRCFIYTTICRKQTTKALIFATLFESRRCEKT